MTFKSSNTERLKNKTNYSLYCVNIFGDGLKTIKDQFKLQASKGLRPAVFVLDLEDVQTELNNQPRYNKLKKDFKENSKLNIMNLTLIRIQDLIKDYEKLTTKINEELKFNLYEYWLKQHNVNKNIQPDKTHNKKSVKESGNKKRNEQKEENVESLCTSSLLVKEHNRVGQSKLLSKRQYVKDEPILGKLYIIILGEMDKSFYMDLLRRNQPLEGIMNFMPTESNYDILLGNNKLRNFIKSTLETINKSIFNLRQEIIFKPVGLFNHKLPVISQCLATKNSKEIFDQLTWSIYDIDILKQQYENYYFKPFQVTNVEIPAGENIAEFYHLAESLSIQGQFQKSSLPTNEADLASIAGYLNSLLNTCGDHKDVVTENGQTNLVLPNSFSTITNINKFSRLVVAENNNLLLNMLKYANLEDFNAIYLCCLDYNVYGQFAIAQQQQASSKEIKSGYKHRPLLPKYVKYYFNSECSGQRIAELKIEYDEYEIQNISEGYKLYVFKKNYHILRESESNFIIPTRLCFRDFTIFQMEEFLKDLKTAEKGGFADIEKVAKTSEFDQNIFIRPNSLKASTSQKELSEKTPRQTSVSHSSKRKSDINSSVSKAATISKESQGLPTYHPLLQGYNLDDTLQEIKLKTSTYNFYQGFIKLYEEKWCFLEMNKQLSLDINNVTLFFSKLRYQLKGISNNVRLVTKDNIGLRILNAYNECSRIVMNYPNGLSIYHHENFCEQIWYCEKTPRDEQKRIYTNFGAIIVFFKSQDVQIMRYNGEIYMLYKHELAEGAEEQFNTKNLEEVQNKSSELVERRSQKLQGTKLLKQIDKLKHAQKLSSEESIKMSSSSKYSTRDLISSLNFELKFLNLLCSIFGLTYLRVTITTSAGKVINITKQGKLFTGLHCSRKEWFDFFANEAYCERSDGVKMLWSQDSYKCFHKDGTVFTTTTAEDLGLTDGNDWESQITQSSSHHEFLHQTEDNRQFIFHDELYNHTKSEQTTFGQLSSNSYLTNGRNNEEYKPPDIHFAQYKCQNMFMQHQNYAEVFIRELNSNLSNLEILGINDIRIYTNKEKCDENGLEINEDSMEEKSNTKLMVNVCFNKNLKIKVDAESCKIYAKIPNGKETESDFLCLSLKYTDNIIDAFNCWVKEIDLLCGENKQELEELYFMEKTNSDSSIRGFEFLSSLPTTSYYKFEMSNNVIELNGINTIDQTFNTNKHEKDLEKFPRFNRGKYSLNPENELPSSLSANVFVEIPKQLQCLMNITKFLEPFEKIYFKSLRNKFKNVLNYFLRPNHQMCLKMLCSRIIWKKRLREHERRVFNEKQRRGLYISMIKYETYPNYWKFTQAYGGDVRCIEFFDFVQNQCNCDSN